MNVIQDLGAMKAKENGKFDPLSNFQIYCAYSERKLMELPAGSVSLSLWSPPYFVGKEYEKGVSYQAWQDMLREVIKAHFYILKPGGFLVINIADILCFKDPKMPRIQANNVSKRRCAVKVPCFMALHARNTSSISRTTAKPQADLYALSSRIGNICVRRLCLKDSYRRIVEDIVQQCLASDERNLAPIKRKICHTA